MFGKGESKTRLTGMILDRLANDSEILIKSGDARKDYLYTKDIAAAFCKFLDGNVEGCVNICSGRSVSIREFVSVFACIAGKKHLLRFTSTSDSDTSSIVGNNERLINDVGYVQKWQMDIAIREIIRENSQE